MVKAAKCQDAQLKQLGSEKKWSWAQAGATSTKHKAMLRPSPAQEHAGMKRLFWQKIRVLLLRG